MKTYHVILEIKGDGVRSVYINSSNKNQAKDKVREVFNGQIRFINVNQVKKWKL